MPSSAPPSIRCHHAQNTYINGHHIRETGKEISYNDAKFRVFSLHSVCLSVCLGLDYISVD